LSFWSSHGFFSSYILFFKFCNHDNSEIAIFEGSMLHYGKEFREISSQIGTKSTREVIDFYYIWKKTDHYKKWKETFISDEDLLDEYNVQPPVKKPKR